ncbi:MAG: CHRD domain-containing protein [Alphaproteobacteria bacterium]|nr:CHRD domain-containing protein [Alphaproteobacteria bacterium]
MKTTLIGASLAVTALFAIAPAYAEVQNYTAVLNAASEVPANDSKGTGTLTATYDTASKKLTYTVTYKDLSGPATMAHFHGPSDAKANAPVVVPAKDAGTSPIKGEVTLTDAQAADLTGGKWYFNIHTDKLKPGEIRGQVAKK